MENYNYNDYLMHYGVKGMKWGVRRYQNPDGSLTPAGIKKYAQAGYSQDSYNSNKTRVGKAYDKVTSAHKYAGAAMYRASSDKQRKTRAEKYVADQEAAKEASKQATKDAVKNYSKKFDSAEKASNIADQKWNTVSEQYKALGKNRVQRIINASRNKTEAAKQYNASYDDWERSENIADDLWSDAKEAYKDTGRNWVNRVMNNIRYN